MIRMVKRKSNHVIPGMNAAKGQGKGADFNEEMASEPELTAKERMNNKKRKESNNKKLELDSKSRRTFPPAFSYSVWLTSVTMLCKSCWKRSSCDR